MTLAQYAKLIAEFAEMYPDATAVTVSDDIYYEVTLYPVAGHFADGEFYSDPEDMRGRKINAVCVN